MQIDGACHCGNISFNADADPGAVTVCHCTDCQAISGTAYRVVVRVPADKVQWKGGKAKEYTKTAESGTKRVQAFCPECGTPVYSTDVGQPKAYGLRLGTIRQRSQLRPAKQIWCRSALSFATVEGVPQVAKQP